MLEMALFQLSLSITLPSRLSVMPLKAPPRQYRPLLKSSPSRESSHSTQSHGQLWTLWRVLPVGVSLSTALSTILLAQATPLLTPITAGPQSDFNNIVDISVLTEFPSDRNLLKHGIITVPKNDTDASYTILLMGGEDVKKSSLLKFIANVLLGNDIDHYDLDILNKGGTNTLPHLYEIMSVSGTLVSA